MFNILIWQFCREMGIFLWALTALKQPYLSTFEFCRLNLSHFSPAHVFNFFSISISQWIHYQRFLSRQSHSREQNEIINMDVNMKIFFLSSMRKSAFCPSLRVNQKLNLPINSLRKWISCLRTVLDVGWMGKKKFFYIYFASSAGVRKKIDKFSVKREKPGRVFISIITRFQTSFIIFFFHCWKALLPLFPFINYEITS